MRSTQGTSPEEAILLRNQCEETRGPSALMPREKYFYQVPGRHLIILRSNEGTGP